MKRYFIAVLLIFVVLLSAQEVSEKKEIAIFNLSYYDWTIPNGALGMVDSQIRNVFVNLGRFDVLGMTYRLNANDVQAFIDKIKEFKASNVEIPEEVRLGQETFTESDFNKLTGSFITIIPSVTYYNEFINDDGDYEVELETDFSFINIEEMKTIAQFTVSGSGTSEDSIKEAAQYAAESIPSELSFKIRSISEFQIKSGVLERKGNTVVIQLGNNIGIVPGDEFTIVKKGMISSGFTYEENTALLIIKEVQQEFSYASIVYSKEKINPGDQVQELPRMGVDLNVYVDYLSGLSSSNSVLIGLAGSGSRGFYGWAPLAGVEIFTIPSSFYDIYLGAYAGAELDWRFLRLELNPMAALGVAGTYDTFNEEPVYTHFGLLAKAKLSYLFTDNLKVYVQTGFTGWFGNYSLAGLTVGGGIIYKF